jgi:hypothetical protein
LFAEEITETKATIPKSVLGSSSGEDFSVTWKLLTIEYKTNICFGEETKGTKVTDTKNVVLSSNPGEDVFVV